MLGMWFSISIAPRPNAGRRVLDWLGRLLSQVCQLTSWESPRKSLTPRELDRTPLRRIAGVTGSAAAVRRQPSLLKNRRLLEIARFHHSQSIHGDTTPERIRNLLGRERRFQVRVLRQRAICAQVARCPCGYAGI